MHRRLTVILATITLVLGLTGTACAQYDGGNENVVVDPTDIEAGTATQVSFDYEVWRNGGDAGMCPWEVRLGGTEGQRDGVLLASGANEHPGTGMFVIMSVSTQVTVPADTPAGEATMKLVSSAAEDWSEMYTEYTHVPVTVLAPADDEDDDDEEPADTNPPTMRFWARKTMRAWRSRMTLGAIVWRVKDDVDPNPIVNIDVSSNEDIEGDWRVKKLRGRYYLFLRATTDSPSQCREYYVDVVATDAAGNETCKTATVKVLKKLCKAKKPKNSKKGK